VVQSSPSGAPAYDQTVSFTVTVSSASGTPVGSVSLIVDGITKQTTALNNGQVSFSLAGGTLTGGSHSIEAQYLGKDTGTIVYSASTSPVLTENVMTVSTSTALTYSTAYITPNSQPAGTALVMTATVGTTYAGTPTGTVTFNITDTGGNKMVGIGALTPTSSGYQATYSYMPIAPASGTTYNVATVLVSYSGDTNFSSSSSAASTFDVTASQGSVVTSISSTSFTTSASNPGSTTFNFVGYGGWAGVVGFSCDSSTLPADSRCQFSPGQASIQASTTSTSYPSTVPVTLTLLVDQQPNVPTLSLWFAAFDGSPPAAENGWKGSVERSAVDRRALCPGSRSRRYLRMQQRSELCDSEGNSDHNGLCYGRSVGIGYEQYSAVLVDQYLPLLTAEVPGFCNGAVDRNVTQ
jgi:hypothetical protein